MKNIVAATFLLAACSPDVAPPIANDVSANVAAVAAPVAGTPPLPPADSGAVPKPGEQKTFRDWTVACDNVARCTMGSLDPADGAFPDAVLQVTRAAGPAGGYELSIDMRGEDAAAPAAILIDAQRFAVAPDGLSGAAAARVVGAMANGRALSFADAKGGTIGTASLAGAAAALRYIDAAQGRAGTVTAAVAKGARPADTVPAAPSPPVVVAPALGAAVKPSAAQLTDMRRIAQCEERMADSMWNVTTGAIGGNATLVLLPCSAGAYNEIDALFVIRDGKVTPAQTDAPSGFDETGADSQTPVRSVVNGAIENGILTSYAKGRGLGDCGVTQGFAWDGRRLRLVDQAQMGECRGNTGYQRTWHARVERR